MGSPWGDSRYLFSDHIRSGSYHASQRAKEGIFHIRNDGGRRQGIPWSGESSGWPFFCGDGFPIIFVGTAYRLAKGQ